MNWFNEDVNLHKVVLYDADPTIVEDANQIIVLVQYKPLNVITVNVNCADCCDHNPEDQFTRYYEQNSSVNVFILLMLSKFPVPIVIT